jgi:polyisoprenoid-binding protein YceI
MRLILLACCAMLSTNVFADWKLNAEQSELSFIATKDARVADNHYFNQFSGHIKDDGSAELIINTASVETSISKRNQRLKNILFRTSDFPHATVNLSVRRAHLKPQPPGTRLLVDVTANVSLVGVTLQEKARVSVVHLASGQVEVSTVEPILLDSEDYGLLPAVNQLREIAGLKSLTIKVPVSFRLVFDKE